MMVKWLMMKHCPCLCMMWFGCWYVLTALSCPRLSVPAVGQLVPDSCTSGKTFPGHHCVMTCPRGYRVLGPAVLTCLLNQQWSPSEVPPCHKGAVVIIYLLWESGIGGPYKQNERNMTSPVVDNRAHNHFMHMLLVLDK